MFGRKCTLCGGKLDSRMICTECGLNNSKSEKYYKINKSSCDGQPLTHVHEDARDGQKGISGRKKEDRKYTDYEKPEKKQQKKQQKKEPEQYTWQGTSGNTRKQKQAKWVGKFVTAFVVMSIVGTVIGSIFDDEFSDSGESYEEGYPYETIIENGYELSEYGEDAELELTSGKYIVGVHIPEGNYRADEMEEYDAIRVTDYENSIFLYEYPAKEGDSYLDDLWLYEGALVEITAKEAITLTTENAQPVEEVKNPLTRSCEFEGNAEKTAGIDFEAGVYDLKAIQGYGTVRIDIYDDESDDDQPFAQENIYIGENSSDGNSYSNVIIPEGAKLIIEEYAEGDDESFAVTLVPSPVIASTGYLETYKENY